MRIVHAVTLAVACQLVTTTPACKRENTAPPVDATSGASSGTPGSRATGAPRASVGSDATVAAFELVGDGESAEGMRALKTGHAVQGGCGEVWVTKPVAGEGPPESRLKTAIARSIAKDEDLRVDSVVRLQEGGWVAKLSGNPKFAGVCAVPRLKFPVEQAAKQLGPVSIELNGSAKDWRCLGDETGEGECWQQPPAPRASGGQK